MPTDTQPMGQPAPKPEPDFQDRVKSLQSELDTLLGKYELGLAATPALTPDGRIGAQPIWYSTRYMPKKEVEAKKPTGLSEA